MGIAAKLLHGRFPPHGIASCARTVSDVVGPLGAAMMIPRGKYLGELVGDPPEAEAEHFVRCPACDGWIDCRDLGQVFEHTRCRINPNDSRTHA